MSARSIQIRVITTLPIWYRTRLTTLAKEVASAMHLASTRVELFACTSDEETFRKIETLQRTNGHSVNYTNSSVEKVAAKAIDTSSGVAIVLGPEVTAMLSGMVEGHYDSGRYILAHEFGHVRDKQVRPGGQNTIELSVEMTPPEIDEVSARQVWDEFAASRYAARYGTDAAYRQDRSQFTSMIEQRQPMCTRALLAIANGTAHEVQRFNGVSIPWMALNFYAKLVGMSLSRTVECPSPLVGYQETLNELWTTQALEAQRFEALKRYHSSYSVWVAKLPSDA